MRETWVWSMGQRSPGEGKGYPLQYSGLENSMVCIVHGVTKSRTQLSNFHFQICRWHHPYGRKWRGVKEPLDEVVKEESWKSWLKTQHSKNEDHGIRSQHFLANRWGNSVNSDRLYFFCSPKSLQMVTTASHEIERCLLLGRKVMTNLDSLLKSRDITLPTKVTDSTDMSLSKLQELVMDREA